MAGAYDFKRLLGKRKRKIKTHLRFWPEKVWEGVVMAQTEIGERQVWRMSRIKNYILDKSEMPINKR